PLRLMAVLSAAVPADLPVTLDSWQQDGRSLRVAGVSDSFESVNRVQQTLEESGSFASVEIRDVHAAVDGKGVNFQLTLALGDVGPGA
ncbi:MAG: PilN domain-containing protein, partial [bacterium]